MNKNRKNIFTHIAGLISSHPWLKLISLLLAVIIWSYVKGEVFKS
jgi:hypothetical protein